MMGHVCKNCNSYAINPHLYNREWNVDLDLCDVCYWRKRSDEAREMSMDLYRQECCIENDYGQFYYDHMCNSTYEQAQEKLIEWGLLKQEDCVRK